MRGYTAGDVAKLLGLPVARVRAYARAGFLTPARGARGEYRFSFQDLVLLRTAQGLSEAEVPERKVRRALRKLRQQLASGQPLTGVRIAAVGETVVVRDDERVWDADSGQELFDFDVGELASKVAPLARREAALARRADRELDAEDWYSLGCELEAAAPEDARDAYRRAIELDPLHADAHVNLGRLLHEGGQVAAALRHYRVAMDARPDDATAAFNVGVALEDLRRPAEAITAYERALHADPDYADAHFNVARLYERAGQGTKAVRHLKAYRQLVLR